MSVILPKHMASFTLWHNDHLDVYEDVKTYVKFEASEWSSVADYEKACETNELWCAQWYPDTPIASCRIYASTFKELMRFMILNNPDIKEYE